MYHIALSWCYVSLHVAKELLSGAHRCGDSDPMLFVVDARIFINEAEVLSAVQTF